MKKYQIVYADPPWSYSRGVFQKWRPINNGKDRVLSDFYPSMTERQLCDLKIKDISDNDCSLFMWFTYSHFPQALRICESWGFKYKTIAFVWVKRSNKGNLLSNIGSWTMGNSEAVLIATKGNMLKHKKRNDIKQLIEPFTTLRLKGNNGHSKKPNVVRERIEALFGDLPRIELFARQKTEGWDVWGNEVKSDINLTNH